METSKKPTRVHMGASEHEVCHAQGTDSRKHLQLSKTALELLPLIHISKFGGARRVFEQDKEMERSPQASSSLCWVFEPESVLSFKVDMGL